MTPSPRKTLYLPRLWRGLLTGLALVGIAIAVGVLPVVRFTWEQIDIYVGSDHVTVEGTYVYENPWPIPVAQGFSIPLPIDEEFYGARAGVV